LPIVRITADAIVGQYGFVQIRPFQTPDAAAAAELFNAAEPEFVRTPEVLLHNLRSDPAAMRRKYWVAVDAQDVVGVASGVLRWWSNELDAGQIQLGVGAGHRRRGIGSGLLRAAEEHLAAHGARRLLVRAERDSVGTRFAAARGYSRRVASEVLWSLDPSEANIDELPELERRVGEDGFRLSPLRDVLERASDFFEFYCAAGGIPPGTPATFEEWRTAVFENPTLDFDGSSVVLREGQPVALAWLLVDRRNARAENEWTATLPAFRGRGLARLAKLATIRWAAANGIREVRTENDVENAPMLAINRRLGYREVAIRDDLERSGNGVRASAGKT
jgi:RimJ/RimL family protein N-acetyltransferase